MIDSFINCRGLLEESGQFNIENRSSGVEKSNDISGPISQEEVINKEKELKEHIKLKNGYKQIAMYCVIFLVMVLFSRG